MGNSSCGQYKHSSSVNLEKPSDHCIQSRMYALNACHGEQNIEEGGQDIEECSPISKLNFKFLNATLRAVDMNNLNGKQNMLNQKNHNKAGRLQKLQSTQKNLNEWSKKVEQNAQNLEKGDFQQKKGKRSSKIEALKNYSDFISNKSKESGKLVHTKVVGDSFCKIRQEPIQSYYQINQRIGQGSFGSVYKGKCLKMGEIRAIKILKQKIMNQQDEKLLLDEINILKKMDHINIIKIYDVFLYNSFFYVVTEYCQGGSLLTALQKNEIGSQKNVAFVMKQIISALCYMHKMKIAHRDLKLENVVLVKKALKPGEESRIKIIDFGLASYVKYQYRNKTGLVGTLQYMAPQIFQQFYSCHSDIWSCGIMMYLLLTGYNPFKKKSFNQTIKSIKSDPVNCNKNIWSKLSDKAKKLLSQMLVRKPEKRITCQKILQSQWIKQGNCQLILQMKSSDVVKNFNNYNRGNNFVNFIKNFLVSRELSQDMRQQMALIFQKIDTDSSGVIQKEQLMKLYSLVTGATDQHLQSIIEKVDQNKSGRIDFQEFLICMSQNQVMHNKKYIQDAFRYLDQDQTGFIEKAELDQCLEGCDQKQILKILKQVDFNGDGKISRDQFIQYLLKVPLQ